MKHIVFILIIFFTVNCRGRSRNHYTKHLSKRDSYSEASFSKSIIKMREENGVYFVPIEVNGQRMEFIFDTGASIISMSETEALFLWKQGKLKENDFIGSVNFQDANGDISEGTIVNLCTVKIGNKLLNNVQASIVHNQIAPLLFGQSAMNRFGKITIDYKKNEILFEENY